MIEHYPNLVNIPASALKPDKAESIGSTARDFHVAKHDGSDEKGRLLGVGVCSHHMQPMTSVTILICHWENTTIELLHMTVMILYFIMHININNIMSSYKHAHIYNIKLDISMFVRTPKMPPEDPPARSCQPGW